MAYESNLQSSYYNLQQHILRLTELLEIHAVDASVYEFPNHTRADLGVEPDAIPVVAHTGQQAIAKALLHYHHFKIDEHQPGAFTRKLAGTLLIECPPHTEEEIRGRVAAINSLKAEFEQLILDLNPVQDVRFEMFSAVLPLLCKLSITRQLPMAMTTIKRINYAWTARKVGGLLTRDRLLKQIQRARSQPKPSAQMGDWLAGLDREEKIIAGYPKSAIFVERRESRVTAMMKLHYPMGHTPKETSVHAHSPLLIINDTPKVSELKTYIKPEEESVNEEKYELVIPRLCLYLFSADGQPPTGAKHKDKAQ